MFLFGKSLVELTKKNAIRYIISRGPVAAALILLCFLFSCVSNQILDIKKTYTFAFKESRKESSLEIDDKLSNKALSLYSELSKFPLIK